MKKILFLTIFFSPLYSFSQVLNQVIDFDSIDKVIIIDHQNFNYEWVCGRRYEIIRSANGFIMRRVEQYSTPYYFGQSSQTEQNDSLDFDKMILLEKMGVATENSDSLITVVNEVITNSQSFWEQKINIQNTTDTLLIESFDELKLLELITSINDQNLRHPRYILENLNMDSVWIGLNAERLLETYGLADIEPTQEQKDFCLSCFFDSKKSTRASYSLIGNHNTSDYPFIEVKLITRNDTIDFFTDNPTPLSMPWILEDSIKYYNPKISLLLADLLPDLAHSNKSRLSGSYQGFYYAKGIEEVFAKSMLYKYCTEFNGKKKRRRKRIYIAEEKAGNNR